MSFDRGGLTVYQYCSAMLPEWLLLCFAGKIHRLYQMGLPSLVSSWANPLTFNLHFA